MGIFTPIKRHPEISIVFAASFLAVLMFLDLPLATYALNQTGIGRVFAGYPTMPPAKYKIYPTLAPAKIKTANNGQNLVYDKNIYSQDLLTIPALDLSAPIIYSLSNNEEDIQQDLEKGVAHFNNTAAPGEKGKILIVGHSSAPLGYQGEYATVFTSLNNLAEGDEINIYSKNKKYTYRVFKKEIAEPILKNMDEKTDDSILILMTCWPPGTSWKRLFVYAKLEH